jgi:four helix bundle protein
MKAPEAIAEAEPQELRSRTKAFALRIIRLYGALPNRGEGWVLGKQFLRSGTSVGAQYREACRARSSSEFISKMQSAVQELDETAYWLELLAEAEIVPGERLVSLRSEADELIAIFVASINTAKARTNA